MAEGIAEGGHARESLHSENPAQSPQRARRGYVLASAGATMRRLVLVVAVLHARLAACSIGDYPLPAASHSVLADTSVVYELLSTGETCEDNPGYTSIYSQNECSYAGNLVRCGLTAGKASCAGTTEYPCGCTYGPASAGADRLKFAQGCGFSGLPCSSTHQCVCRDAVSGSYSLVSSGSCDSNGLELVGGANECTAAAALLHLTGAKPPGCSGALGCCGTPILASTLATGDCYNKNRGPKCSVWTLSSGSTTGWLHYRPDNYTNSNRAPWSCSHPSPLACSSQHVKCLCKRARVQPPPSPPPPPGLPPGTALPPPPPVPSCVCAGDTVIREPTSTCSATGDPHYRNFAGYARAARTAACSCAARRGPRLPSAGLRVSPPSLSRTCTPRHGCAYYTHPGSSSSSAQAHTSRPDAVWPATDLTAMASHLARFCATLVHPPSPPPSPPCLAPLPTSPRTGASLTTTRAACSSTRASPSAHADARSSCRRSSSNSSQADGPPTVRSAPPPSASVRPSPRFAVWEGRVFA